MINFLLRTEKMGKKTPVYKTCRKLNVPVSEGVLLPYVSWQILGLLLG